MHICANVCFEGYVRWRHLPRPIWMGELGCRPLKWRLLINVHLPTVFFISAHLTPGQGAQSVAFLRASEISSLLFTVTELLLRYSVLKRVEAVQCFVWIYLIGVISTPLLPDPQSQLEQETEFQRKTVSTFERGRVSRLERVLRLRRILHLREGKSV